MRRAILLLLLFFPLTSPAQQRAVGIRAGLTYGSFSSGENFPETEPLLNFLMGAYRRWALKHPWEVEGGIYFSRKGLAYENDTEASRTVRSYIMLPVVVRRSMAGKINLHLGAYAATLVHTYTRHTLFPSNDTFNNRWMLFSRNRNSAFTRYDLGGQVGLRYVLPINLVLQASYEHGLVELLTFVNDGPVNRTITVSIGFQ